MADDCTISATCAYLAERIDGMSDDMAELAARADASLETVDTEADFLLALVNRYPGGWVTTEGGVLPSVAELVNRASNFPAGFAAWHFFEYEAAAARDTITLPGAVTGPVRVFINGVQLPVSDYSLASDELTLDDPLEPGDLLTVRAYGA